jgi:hypothetical protein
LVNSSAGGIAAHVTDSRVSEIAPGWTADREVQLSFPQLCSPDLGNNADTEGLLGTLLAQLANSITTGICDLPALPRKLPRFVAGR